jgi:hypothetical protein
LPQRGKVIVEGEDCEHCGAPRVKIISKGRRPWDICINMQCIGKSGGSAKGKKGAASEKDGKVEEKPTAKAKPKAPKAAKARVAPAKARSKKPDKARKTAHRHGDEGHDVS